MKMLPRVFRSAVALIASQPLPNAPLTVETIHSADNSTGICIAAASPMA
jgi:hypothetical protein